MPCNNCNHRNCNGCQAEVHICNQCPPEQPCDCPIKDLGTDCILYNQDPIECNDVVVIQTNTILSIALKNIVDWACNRFAQLQNYLRIRNVGAGAGVYKGDNLLGEKELKSLTKTGDLLIITPSTNEINFTIDETELINFVQEQLPSPTCVESESLEVTETVEGCFKVEAEIVSDSLVVSQDSVGVFRVEQPASFQGTDYYVNNNYTGQQETGTASKPFRNLKRCLDIILNRAYQNEAFVWIETPNPTINSGNTYNKWDFRSTQIRIRVQSFTHINENIALNNVIYLLEEGVIQIPPTNTTLERLIDMKELVDNCPKDGDNKLNNNLACIVIGKGRLQNYSTVRKGIARAYGHFGGSIDEFQNTSHLFLGDINSEIFYDFQKLTSLTYVPLYSDNANTIPIVREGIAMTGHIATTTPSYAVFEFENENAPFRYSLFVNGVHHIDAFEQNLFLGNNSGFYGENGTLYLRRNYQHVNFSTIETINTVKYYKPSLHVHDIYLKEGAFFDFGGRFYTQENTGMNQGGSESFVCLESTNPSKLSVFRANGGGIIFRQFYNHYFKIINNSTFTDYQSGSIVIKNLNMASIPFVNLFDVVDETGAPKTELNFSILVLDSFLQDVFEQNSIRRDFSNIVLNSELFIQGNLIKITNSIMLPSVPIYLDNSTAVLANMPIGSFYKDIGGFLKIVE